MNNFQNLIKESSSAINALILIVMGIALLVFFWGLTKYIFEQGNETAKTQGKGVMVWGLIALTVMVSVWGIIRVFQGELNLNNSTPDRIDPNNPFNNRGPCGGVFQRPCL
jgi:hypothetical protein